MLTNWAASGASKQDISLVLSSNSLVAAFLLVPDTSLSSALDPSLQAADWIGSSAGVI